MRQAIGGAWLLGIVMTFMMVFIAYISISMNYSKAFKVKTDVITVLEEYQGFNDQSIDKIYNILQGNGYRSKGTCVAKDEHSNVYGVTDKTITKNPSEPQHFCITKTKKETKVAGSSKEAYYYQVDMFFGFSLPIIGDIYTFRINGETNPVLYPVEKKGIEFTKK